MAEGRIPAAAELPIDAIREAAGRFTSVVVKVGRQNAKGQWATITTNVVMQTSELLHIEQWIMDVCGGGRFRVEIRDPQNPLGDFPVPPFFVEIDAPPKPPQMVQEALHGSEGYMPPGMAPMHHASSYAYDGRGGVKGPNGGHNAPGSFVAGLTPNQRAHWERMQAEQRAEGAPPLPQAPAARHSSDEIAYTLLQKMEQRLDVMQRERDKERVANERAREEDRRRLEQERIQSQQEFFKAQIEMIKLQSRPVEPPKPAFDVTTIAALVGAAAPIITAIITSSRDREARILETQTKSQDAQREQMNALMSAMMTRPKDDGVEKILAIALPALMPLVMEFTKQKSPEAQAALLSTMAENQLAMISMFAQFIQEQTKQDGEQPWWFPMIQEGLNGVVQMAGAIVDARKKVSPAITVPALPQPAVPQQMAAQPSANVPPNGMPQTGASRAEWNAWMAQQPPEQLADSVIAQLPGVPKTPEWRQFLIDIHSRKPVEELAAAIVDHLVDLDDSNKLDRLFLGVFEHPDSVFAGLLSHLPIAAYDIAYAESLHRALCAEIASREAEEDDDRDTSEQETKDSEPAPTVRQKNRTAPSPIS